MKNEGEYTTLESKEELRQMARQFIEEAKKQNLRIWQAKELFRFAIDEIENQTLK